MAGGNLDADSCWCMTVTISPQALERVPDELKNQTCLCPACATGRVRNQHADRDEI